MRISVLLLAMLCTSGAAVAQEDPRDAEVSGTEAPRDAEVFGREDPREGEVFGTSDPREDAMFGSEDEAAEGEESGSDSNALDELDASAADREDALFGGQYGGTELGEREWELLTEEKLQIGGLLYLRYRASGYDDHAFDPTAAMPNLLDLYVDGRPNDRVRGFVKGRLSFDPVTTSSLSNMPTGVADEIQEMAESLKDVPGIPEEAIDQINQLTARPDSTRAILDQFWLKFDIARRVYVTVGKQPIHWGTTRLWNPVDVVNATRREPLTLFDTRTGVSALKLHVPIESLAWNVIGIVLVEGAADMGDIGGALRLEMAMGAMEVGLTGMVRTETVEKIVAGEDGAEDLVTSSEMVVPKVGLDWSAGIWELDFTAEASASFQDQTRLGDFTAGDREILIQAAGGVSYTHKYSAEDFLVVGLEYFFNPDGHDSKDDYPGLFQSGGFTPFYLGKHYGAAYLALPGPGTWDHTNFTISNVANFSDMSFFSRFDYNVSILTYLSVQAYAQIHYGEPRGEFRFGLAANEFFPGSPEIPTQLYTVGVNLRIDM
jgi:hypothetical protein